MTDLTEIRFSQSEERLLAVVLDELIPPRDDGGLPGAGTLGVGAHVRAALRSLPDLAVTVSQGLVELERAAQAGDGAPFAALPRQRKVELLKEQPFVLLLSIHAFVGYYQHPRVLAALGLPARPPHPEGHRVEASDWTLLEAVRQRPKIYRDA